MNKMILGLLASAMIAAIPSTNASAQIKVFSTGDIAVMQQNENGTYSVVCSNGNRETVTDLDIELGNVCPNRTQTTPSGILSLQKREDASFDVVCKDFKRVVATAEEIMAGKVCTETQPPAITIEDGLYKDDVGYFCDQNVTATHKDGKLESLHFQLTGGCSMKIEMSCVENNCKGSTSGYEWTAEILSKDSYEFTRVNDGRKGTFKKAE